MLTPCYKVMSVGEEMVLVAGVGGPDNYLSTHRRLEWSLAGDGHFVDVGRNGLVDLLLGDFNRPRKVDNSFVIGSTSRHHLRLTRGTATVADDVRVVPGQGWITLTSPVEGTSKVTVFAPDVYSWESRTRSATVHWVDAQWCIPPPAINPAGTTHVFTTCVVRQSDRNPCAGWLVRYEIVDGPPAGFAPDGAQSIEVPTDGAGQASVQISQKAAQPGTNRIAVAIIRPAALGGPGGTRLEVGSGSTLKTWTSPELALSKTGPATVGLGGTLSYRIEVSNPGDVQAEQVVVTDDLPLGLEYIDSEPAAEPTGRKLQWQFPHLGAAESRLIRVNCRATKQGAVNNCAEATATGSTVAAGTLKASDCAATTVTAPTVDVRISGPTRAVVGDDVTFEILVTNRSQILMKKLLLKDTYDPGLQHEIPDNPIEAEVGDLAPGQSQPISVTFRVVRAGVLRHTAEVIGSDGIRATAEARLTAVDAVAPQPFIERPAGQPPAGRPPTGRPPAGQPPAGQLPTGQPPFGRAAVTVTKSAPTTAAVGQQVKIHTTVTNAGDRTLRDIKVVESYPASLNPLKASGGLEHGENSTLFCFIDSLQPGQSKKLTILYECIQPAFRATTRVTAMSSEATSLPSEAMLEIRTTAADTPTGGLAMKVTGLTNPVRKGGQLTYEVEVTNEGSVADTQVVLTATVPLGMIPARLGTTTQPQIGFDVPGQTFFFAPVARLRPGEKLVYRIRVLARESGNLTFRTELASDGLDRPLRGQETTEVF
ncbi:MAG: DUF11 domain-containing protein [Candidatus Nealsonbacteria bacterium]|nr:DUF11 domain-containing protein [Candidatus Nealsonbacteria bacterium]